MNLMAWIILFLAPGVIFCLWYEYRTLQKTGLFESINLKESFSNFQYGALDLICKIFFKSFFILPYIWMHDFYHIFEMPKGNPVLWLSAFVGMDFVYYWYHRSAHEIRFLWAFHLNHHEIKHMNLTAGFRMSVASAMIKPLFYLPLAVIGFPVQWIILSELILQLYQFPLHTETFSKWPKGFNWLFCNPENHRVHHGSNPIYIDKNYAGTLIIWDHLFGTYQAQEEKIRYGIGEKPIMSNAIVGNLMCFKEAWRRK